MKCRLPLVVLCGGLVVGWGWGSLGSQLATGSLPGERRVSVKADAGPGVRLESPYLGHPHWCKGSTHVHTESLPLEEMVFAYKKKGYQFVFLTDHQALTDVSKVVGLRAFSGEEISTTHGHACALFVRTLISKDPPTQEAIDQTHAQGGLLQLNHLSRSKVGQEVLDQLSGLWGMEVRNGKTPDDRDITLWDSQLAQGKRLWGTFTDDSHVLEQVGQGWIMVNSPDSQCGQGAIFEGLNHGNFYMTRGPTLEISVNARTLAVSSDREGTIQ